jgi:Skp family chaperone for outer membrane proteins
MMSRQTGATLVSALALSALAPMAFAQTSGGQAAQEPLTTSGPAIIGICVLSEQGLVAGSLVGKSVAARIQQLAQQADAEINGQATTLQNDEKAFESARASYSQEQLQQKAAALQGRERDLQRLAQQRNQELDATRQKRIGEVLTNALPIIRQQVQQHNCSVLFEGSQVVLAVNPSMDLTSAVIQGLNAKITTLTFDREHAEAGAASGAR